jgi:hypothetical protein
MTGVWLALWLWGCAGGGPSDDPNADADGDGANAGYDCDDNDPTRNPRLPEICNDVDDDCSGTADENAVDARRWFPDVDRDSHGDTQSSVLACNAPSGFVAAGDDCDDADAGVHPGATERCDGRDQDCDFDIDDGVEQRDYWADADRDGWGDDDAPLRACSAPTGYAAESGDCDDTDPRVHPEADESDCADPVDYNCDGAAAVDDDDDGWFGCSDCDDQRADVNPDAEERCDDDGDDDDCDGVADDDDIGPAGRVLFFIDGDADGYGDGTGVLRCDGAGTRTALIAGDCDDADASVNPGEIELCDADDVDEDCDGLADDVDSAATGTAAFYADDDGDGWGAGVAVRRCDPSDAYTATASGDCDDADARRSPGLAEICDASDRDEDCDGAADDNDGGASGTSLFYTDADNDGYGVAPSVLRCDASGDYRADNEDDCDDGDAEVAPGAAETAGDGVDDDCDGVDLAAIRYAEIYGACDYTVDSGTTVTVEGRVRALGITDATGAGALVAEAAWGDVATDPSGWTWVAASWSRDVDGSASRSDDVWSAPLTPADGAWGVLWRFSNDGRRTWLYGDLGAACGASGSDDGADDPAAMSVVDPDDRDGDGYSADDCDDADPAINPGEPEIWGDGVDNDCDGTADETVAVSALAAGDLVITEILYDPAAVADADGEWFEIYNPGDDAIALSGLVVESARGTGTESFTVGADVVLPERGYVILGRSANAATNGGVSVDYAWGAGTSALALSNSGDSLKLYYGSTVFDAVTYGTTGGWPTAAGKSLELAASRQDATSNDTAANWCAATTTFGAGDKGSPGAVASGC